MISLSSNWLTEPLFDLEYKQYLVLAYLQQAEQALNRKALFPYHAQLKIHNEYLRATRIGFYDSELLLHDHAELPDGLALVGDIIDFALPKFEEMMCDFSYFEDKVKSSSRIEFIGLQPLFNDAGYLLLPSNSGFIAYSYIYPGIVAVNTYNSLIFESIALFEEGDSTKARFALYDYLQTSGNPAVFVLRTEVEAPIEDTLLPLSGSLIYEYIAKGKQ